MPGGARLIVVDPNGDQVQWVYHLDEAVHPGSYVDDVRVNGPMAPHRRGHARPDRARPRLGSSPTRAGRSSERGGRAGDRRRSAAARPDGTVVRLHTDQLEVSPDGRWLYYQPASGGMSRIATRWLDDPSVSTDEMARRVERWCETPSTGGTAIDTNGTIYLSDVEHRRVLAIAPDRGVRELVADPRLAWVDALWLDADSRLWMPAAQLHLTAGLNGGQSAVDYPVHVYRMPVEAGPPRLDHA
ncbi:hypothetical protein NKG94_14005 [Micromonospora sp. M12]